MKRFMKGMMLAAGALSLAACVTRHETTREVVHEQPVVEEHTTIVDPHETWWHTYHASETYDREHALALHRAWCDDHPSDSSCTSWYVRH